PGDNGPWPCARLMKVFVMVTVACPPLGTWCGAVLRRKAKQKDTAMADAFFMTGTYTEVGKTYIASALLRGAAAQGLTTLAVKPVAAGCEETPEGRRNEDALRLQEAMTLSEPYERINPVALLEPLSPHLAARHEGVEISVQDLADHCRRMLER